MMMMMMMMMIIIIIIIVVTLCYEYTVLPKIVICDTFLHDYEITTFN
jgi:hypothetical protein